MRRSVIIGLAILTMSGCAADQRITGLASGRAARGELIPVRVISRCGMGSGMGYEPFYVIDGQLYVPGDTAAVSALDPATIGALEILKGERAAARYGPVAGVVGVVVITTHRGARARSRPAA